MGSTGSNYSVLSAVNICGHTWGTDSPICPECGTDWTEVLRWGPHPRGDPGLREALTTIANPEYVDAPGGFYCPWCGTNVNEHGSTCPVRIARAALATDKSSSKLAREFCRDCDGVGWVEGGETIKTTCARCGGDGWEPQ